VNPRNPQLVLVAVYIFHDVGADLSRVGGTYLSTDGGVRFTRTFTHAASDLVQDPSSPDGVFAAFGIDGGCNSCAAPGGVWRSSDFGLTWSPTLTSASPGTPIPAQPGQVKLTISATSPPVLYASVLDRDDAHAAGGLFRSGDGGRTWEKRTVHPQMCPKDGFNQCGYDHTLLVHPTRPDLLYLGTVSLYVSEDGAATWKPLVEVYAPGASIHPDQHALAIPPSAPGTLWVGNDGGLYRTTDGGATFENRSGTLGLIQFNGLAFHPSIPEFLMGGTQDNGNLRTLDGLSWSDRTGSDGGFVLVRADAPTDVLAANYYAYLNHSTTTGSSFRDVTPTGTLMTEGGEPAEPMAFYPPAAAAPAAPGTVFLGAERLWANPTFGADRLAWVPRSAEKVVASGVITAFDVPGDGSGPVWVGGSRGDVLFSTDGGATFATRTAGLPAAIVTDVRAVSADGRSAYVAFGGYLGPPSRHVFVTTDAGITWTNVSGEIPDVPVTALVPAPGDPRELFAATDVGVFRSTDGGASWSAFSAGLPNTTVSSLAFRPGTRDLFAATYGRGAWTIAVPPAGGNGSLTASFSLRPGLPAPGQSVAFSDLSSGEPASWLWSFGDGGSSTERNPRHVFARAGTFPVTLTVSNAGGSDGTTRHVTVAAGAARPVTLQVPVVLDVFGVAPAHYTSDLVAVNRSAAPTRLTLRYLAAPGTPGAGGPRVGASLPAGGELRLGDVVAWLRENGYALPPSGPAMAGTLRLTFEDVEEPGLVWAGSRISTPNPNAAVGGSFGLFLPAVPTSEAPSTEAVVVGLLEDASFRSNLAVVDVPRRERRRQPGAPLHPALRRRHRERRRRAGRDRARRGRVAAGGPDPRQGRDFPRLGEGHPHRRHEPVPRLRRSERRLRIRAGHLRRQLPSGGRHRGARSDRSPRLGRRGELHDPARPGEPDRDGGERNRLLHPFRSLRQRHRRIRVRRARPREELEVGDVLAWLHDAFGIPVPVPPANAGGTLLVRGAVALARTSNPNPDSTVGGSFGLAYPALDASARARTECWVLGLVQDDATRSNLAVADARTGDPREVAYLVEIFADASPGAVPALTKRVVLAGGGWTQLSGILLEAALPRGHARVRVESGSSDFAVYGVLNDGAAPGSRTSDGSFLPMTALR
jgi:PKD repeat protein